MAVETSVRGQGSDVKVGLGQRLIQSGFVKEADVGRALERQKLHGGTLGENLVSLGLVSRENLARVLTVQRPLVDFTHGNELMARESALLDLALKLIYTFSFKTSAEVANAIKLPISFVSRLMKGAHSRKLLDYFGSGDGTISADIQYVLSRTGRDAVTAAFEKSLYVGPAPVTQESYSRQMALQKVTNDRIPIETLAANLSHLVLSERLRRSLGPAVNSGKAILLYGPPGTGKTEIANAIGASFKQSIFVPYAVEVDGQIIKVFDPEIHTPIEDDGPSPAGVSEQKLPLGGALPINRYPDHRWVMCKRPVAMVGSELSQSMLDLFYNQTSKIYEAPIQLKAACGVLVIDDFGRQQVSPKVLFNRWFGILEKGQDYLTLLNGRKFPVPCDFLVVFVTNLDPKEILDEAMLRRISYKVSVPAPTEAEFKQIFRDACRHVGVAYEPGIVDRFFDDTYMSNRLSPASYHPGSIISYIVDKCRYEGRACVLDYDLLVEAVEQLMVHW